jgi:NitT/TauT family transport system substrate-binding protein
MHQPSPIRSHRRKRRSRPVALLRGFVAVAAAATLAGCGASAGPSADAHGTTTLKVGVIPGAMVAPVYLGIAKGIFEKAGLKIEPQPAAGGAALLPALLNNQTQVAYSNVVSLMLAQQQGLPVQIVANGALQVAPGSGPQTGRTNAAVVVASGSPIKSAKDLSGKTVAVNTLKNVEEVLTKHSIDQAGGDSSTVRLIEMPTSQMLPALEQGRIDAATLIEPYTTAAIDAGAQILLRPFTDMPDPATNTSVYFASAQFMKQEPELMQRFTTAMNEALDYAQAHPEEARDVVRTYTKIEPDLVERMVLPYWTPKLNVGSIKTIGDLSVKYGLLSSPPDLNSLLGRTPRL